MKHLVVGLLLARMVYGNLLALHETTSSENRASSAQQFCTDLNPQNGLDIEQIMGLWYGSEVITHIGNEDGEFIYDTCVVIHLADATNATFREHPLSSEEGSEVRYATSYGYPGDQSPPSRDDLRRSQQRQHHYRQQQLNSRALRLIWDEKSHTLEYVLRYNNSRPGFWITSGPQVGSMVQMPYVQFTGTVQVLKAINNQLVLTFCQSLPGGQLFSVVLSRKPMSLSVEENQGIRNLLKRRQLSTTSVRKVCYSGTASLFQARDSPMIASAMLIVVAVSSMFRKN